MDFDRNSMNVPVQSSDYTKKFLQKDLNPTTMEVVTQTNAVKSPTDSPETTKLVYTVNDIARMLAISLRSAQDLMRIALMSHIKNDFILRRFQYPVQCNGQFYRAQIGRKMTTGF